MESHFTKFNARKSYLLYGITVGYSLAIGKVPQTVQ